MRITPEIVREFIEDIYGSDLSEKSREQHLVAQRFCYCFLCAKYCLGYSYSEIGSLINRDHASVIHGVKKIVEGRKYDPYLNEYYLEIVPAFEEKYQDFKDIKEVLHVAKYDKLTLIRTNRSLSLKSEKWYRKYTNLKSRFKNLSEQIKKSA